MRRGQYTEEQMIGMLKVAEAGKSAKEICRELGINEQTYYRWQGKSGGLEISEAPRLRQLGDENRRLKYLVTDLTLDNQVLKGLLNRR